MRENEKIKHIIIKITWHRLFAHLYNIGWEEKKIFGQCWDPVSVCHSGPSLDVGR